MQPPSYHGLHVLPFLNRERAPYWRDGLASCINALRLSITGRDITTALTEASFHRLTLLANVPGLTLRPRRKPEASLRGTAVFALEQLGLTPPQPVWGSPILPGRHRQTSGSRAARTTRAPRAEFNQPPLMGSSA